MKNQLRSSRTALLSALVLATFHAFAATPPWPPELPKFGADKPLQGPVIIQHTLQNGLQLWVLPRKGLPRVDFVMALRGAGFGADAADAPGLAKLLAGLLTEGTDQRSSRQIAEAAQSMGGALTASASNDGITLSGNALASHASRMAALLAEVVRQPSFPEAEVTLAKTNALQGLKVASAQPAFRASKALNEAIYGDHAYGRTQETEASIQAVTANGLRAEHARRFRPDRALLIITGRISAAKALMLTKAQFGNWRVNGEPLPELAAPPVTRPVQRLLLDRPGSVQATVRLGQPGAAASGTDQVALRLTSTVLGKGFSSRINLNLREEKGYTYVAWAGGQSFRVGGAITGGADVRNEVTGASLTEFIKEYRRIGKDMVPESEMAIGKHFVAGSYLLSTQLQAAVAQQLSSNWLVGLPAEFLGQYVSAIQKVSPEQLRTTAQRYFNPETQSLVVVGDADKIGEQLKAFGEFTLLKP